MKRTGSAIAVAVGLWSASAFAEVEFYQTVDRNKVGTEDTFRLNIVVSGAPDGATVQFPAPNDFEVLQRSQSTQMSYSLGGGGGTGVIKRVQKYTLVMRANRAGKLTIPPAVLSTAGKSYKSDAVVMEVVKGRTQDATPPQRQQQSPFAFPGFPDMGDDSDPFDPFSGMPEPEIPRSDSDIFLRATIDKESVWVGEQVNYSLTVYSRVDLRAIDPGTMPKFEGFLTEDLDSPQHLIPEQRVIGGVPYRAYVWRRRALFPVKAGELTIEAAGADVTTGFMFSNHRVHRNGNVLTLKVKPLPKDGQGLNVGRWRLTTEASQTTVAVGTPIQVRVALEGRGNLKGAVMPKLTGPSALRIYEPTTSDKLTITHAAIGGRRVQEYVVLPQSAGTFTLPGLSGTYFNPETGRVEESKTDPITISVTAGALGNLQNPQVPVPPGSPAAPRGGRTVTVLDAQGALKPLRQTAQFNAHARPVWSRPWYLPIALAPFALAFSFVLVGAVRRMRSGTDPASEKKRKARIARARLAAAEKLRKAGKTEDFYAEVEKALNTFLEARLGEPAAGLTRAQLEAKMAAAGAAEAVRSQVKSALDTCDMGRFAPGMGDAAARVRALDQAAFAMESWDTR